MSAHQSPLPNMILPSMIVADFFERHPVQAAAEFERLSAKAATDLLDEMDVTHAARVLRTLNPAVAARAIADLQHLPAIAAAIDPPYLARIIGRLGPQGRAACFEKIPEKTRHEIESLLKYPEGTAGYMMSHRFTAFHPKDRIETVIDRVRRTKVKNLTTIHLVDNDGKLTGTIPLQDVIGAEDDDHLESLARPPIWVNELAPRDEVIELVEQNKITSVPVLNADGVLIGSIRPDELFSIVQQDAMTDIQTMVGVSADEKALSKPLFSVRKRLPWLSINLVTTFAAAFVVGMFEETIAKVTALAVLLPVVAGQSGNTGAQAQAVTMRGLALREIRLSHKWRIIAKEGTVGLVNGIAIGALCAIAVFFWSQSLPLSLVIGTSMIIAMVAASLAGAAIPMILSAIGQDPATSSSIVLTTVTDIVGLLSFLGLATLFGHLLI